MEELLFRFSYPAVVVLLIAGGVGVPVPEELVNVTAGVLAGQGRMSLWGAMAACYVGVMAGDLTLYTIGRLAGPRILEQRHFKRLLTPKRVAWIEGHFHKHGMLTIALARLTAGLRAPTYLVAGMSRFPARRFVIADALTGAATVPLVVFLGFHFGARVTAILQRIGAWEHTILAVLAGVILVRALVSWRRRRVRERTGEADAAVRLHRSLTAPDDHDRPVADSP